MHWASPLVANAVTLGLVEPRRVARLARRVQRRSRDLASCDSVWADELVRTRAITRYQAQTLLYLIEADRPLGEATPSTPRQPLQIGAYLVLDRIGRSDLGATYRCRLRDAREPVALKLLDARWGASPELTERVAAGATAWASLGESRVLGVQRVEPENESVALVARWVAGKSLADVLRAGRRLSAPAALLLVRELVAALATADARGLVHGDLKPSNVLFGPRGEVLLVDGGIRSSVSGAGLLAARELPPEKYDCVAPEVAAGEIAPDATSDIYALGCLVYHAATGRPPFGGGNAERKCAAHRAGRPCDPRRLGVELPPQLGTLLEATIQADRSRRVGSYNDLLSCVSPAGTSRARGLGAEFVRRRCAGSRADGPAPVLGAAGRAARTARWLVAGGATAALVAALVHGGKRLLPVLQIPNSTQRVSASSRVPIGTSDRGRRGDPAAVTALWNATEDLRRAYQDAPAGGTITLQSPGPFRVDAIEIDKPITLRAASDVRPLLLGGPGAGLRIVASDVRLENLHFLRLDKPLPGQTARDRRAMIEVSGARLTLADCSFQDTSSAGSVGSAIQWQPDAAPASGQAASIEARNILFRNVAAAVDAAGSAPLRIVLENCLHLGPGPLVRSTSSPGKPFDAVDVRLTRVTVYGAGTVAHSFPHPIDDMRPLVVTADNSFLVPLQRQQPVLSVRYAAQPSTLMPKVTWSGSGTICPADALMLEVSRGPDTAPWRASDIAAWKAYWGQRPTGLLGVRIGFAAAPPTDPAQVPRPRVEGQSLAGADPLSLRYPPPVTLEQLPVLVERLAAQR